MQILGFSFVTRPNGNFKRVVAPVFEIWFLASGKNPIRLGAFLASGKNPIRLGAYNEKKQF